MQHYIIKNGTVIDVENGNTYVGSIEVEGTKVKTIFKNSEVLPEGITTVDAEGKYIIPGLIDMHCHINEAYAPHFVASGVTTIRNTAGNVYLLSNLIEKPVDAPTPRIYASDRMIDGTPGQWGPTSYGNMVTDDPEEARDEVRRQVQAGAKFIKLYGWIKRDVMIAAIDEAKKYNLEVSCDLMNSKDLTALDAAELGVNWIEHASGFAHAMYEGWNPLIDQEPWSHIDWENPDQAKVKEICEKILSYGVKLCPTMVVLDQAAKYPNHWSPENNIIESAINTGTLKEHWQQTASYFENNKAPLVLVNNLTKAIAKTYYDMGGTVVAGTDTPALVYTYPGMALHRELELFVEAGFTTMEALQAATINAANAINLDGIGVIKEGYMADLVILDENPVEKIENTKQIYRVVKGGKVYTQEEILSHIPSKEEAEQTIKNFMEQWDAVNA